VVERDHVTKMIILQDDRSLIFFSFLFLIKEANLLIHQHTHF